LLCGDRVGFHDGGDWPAGTIDRFSRASDLWTDRCAVRAVAGIELWKLLFGSTEPVVLVVAGCSGGLHFCEPRSHTRIDGGRYADSNHRVRTVVISLRVFHGDGVSARHATGPREARRRA